MLFDVDRVQVSGGPVPVVEGVRAQVGLALPHVSVSRTGTLAYVPGQVGTTRDAFSILEADRAGVVTPSKAAPAPYVHIRASRDGTRLAVDTDDGKEAIVSIHDVAGANAPRGDAHVPESWSPDGRHISFSVVKGTLSSLWILSVEDRKTAAFGNVQSAEPIGSVFSPDGRWLACARYQAPRVNLDFMPLWSPDTRKLELLYIPSTNAGQRAAVPVVTTAGVMFGRPESLRFREAASPMAPDPSMCSRMASSSVQGPRTQTTQARCLRRCGWSSTGSRS